MIAANLETLCRIKVLEFGEDGGFEEADKICKEATGDILDFGTDD
jgi:hypothetical protein